GGALPTAHEGEKKKRGKKETGHGKPGAVACPHPGWPACPSDGRVVRVHAAVPGRLALHRGDQRPRVSAPGAPERPGRRLPPQAASSPAGLRRAGSRPELGPPTGVGAEAAVAAREGRPAQAAAGGLAGALGCVFRFRPAPRTIANTKKTNAPM